MPGPHIAGRLRAYLAGTLQAVERADADRHLDGCVACREERDLLAGALVVVRPLPEVDPRVGFAARVALGARDRQKPFARWLRFSLGGLAVASAAAVAMLATAPRQHRNDDLMLAQRLDLLEDLAVVQHQHALEDLDVVEALQALEAHP